MLRSELIYTFDEVVRFINKLSDRDIKYDVTVHHCYENLLDDFEFDFWSVSWEE